MAASKPKIEEYGKKKKRREKEEQPKRKKVGENGDVDRADEGVHDQ